MFIALTLPEVKMAVWVVIFWGTSNTVAQLIEPNLYIVGEQEPPNT